MSLKDVLELNRAVLKGPSENKIKPKDYDIAISDLPDPEAVVATVKARLEQAARYRYPFEEKWRRAFLAYNQILDTEAETSWESKRYMPLILKHIETALPSIAATVFNGKDLWDITGKTPNGRNAADALKKLIHWQARGPSRMEKEFDKGAFFALLFGTAFFDTFWVETIAKRQVPVIKTTQDPNDPSKELENEDGSIVQVKVLQEKEVTVEDWPVIKAINPLSVWPAPWSEEGDDTEWFCLCNETTPNKIKAAVGHGHFDKKAVEAWEDEFFGDNAGGTDVFSDDLFETANSKLWDEWLSEVGGEEREQGTSGDLLDGDKIIKLLVYRSMEETITIAPGDRIIGYSKNPFIHGKTGIINHQFIPVPGSPFGRGLGTILLDHQELQNENINLFMDVAKISLMAPVIVNRGNVSTLDRNFVWRPNKMIHARDINNAAARMDVPAPSALTFQLQQSLELASDEITGFSEQSRGMSPAGVNTATEFTGLQQNIATRSLMHVRRLRRTMGLIGKMLVSLNQQFMTEDQVVSVVGEDGLDYYRVQPWEIVGEVQVIATASVERGNPQMRAQQMIGATQVITGLIQQGKGDPFIMKWIRELLDAIGIENADTMIPKNYGKIRDAAVENIGLRQGVVVEPYPNDNHGEHIQIHSQAMQEAAAEDADPDVLAAYQEHIQQHMGMAQQAAGGPQGGSQPGAEGGDPQRQEAQALGAAQGSNGIPGQASPGPAAAPGRAM